MTRLTTEAHWFISPTHYCFCTFCIIIYFFLCGNTSNQINSDRQGCRSSSLLQSEKKKKNHFSAFVLHSRLRTPIHFLSIHLEASSSLAGSVREIEFYFRLSADARLQGCHVPVWLTLGMHSWASHLPISAAEVSASADMCATSDPQ